MTRLSNPNVVVAASVIAAMVVGVNVNSASAQETETVDAAAISADVADYTAQTSTQLSLRIAEPNVDIEMKLADLEDRSTIKPDYAAYSADRDEAEPVVVASTR